MDLNFSEAAYGEVDDFLPLFAVECIEPTQDVVDVGSGFEVFDDGGDGHARAFENPGTAELAGEAFNGGALGPIKNGLRTGHTFKVCPSEVPSREMLFFGGGGWFGVGECLVDELE